MNLRSSIATSLATAFVASPVLASAVTFNYYVAPKIKSRGTSSTPIAGAGTIVVKVFIKKTGQATSFSVVRSSNHGDDATALEIAKASTYVAATKGGKPQDAFYDYTLKFTASGVAAEPATGTGKFKAMIDAGNYKGAKSGLESYLSSNPNDASAELLLGVADQYLDDSPGAAAAFDKAGTVPSNYDAVAARAYLGAASAADKSKDYAGGIAFAKKAVAIAPGAASYNSLGTLEDANGQTDAAIADLTKARDLAAQDAKISVSNRAQIADNLVSAYVNANNIDQAKVVAADAVKVDPSDTNAQAFIAQYYVRQAIDNDTKQKYAESAGLFEQAAALAPGVQQPDLYARAALTYLKIKDSTPYDKAKADADKALATAPDNALANFAAGIALANQPGKSKDALPYLNKADAASKTGNDTALTTAIENAIKQINGTK